MENARSSEFLNPKFGRQYVANGLSNIPGAFFVYCSNGEEELLYANKELLKIFECETGKQFLELSEGHFKGLVHPDDIHAARTSIRRQLESGNDNLDHLYYRVITRTGKVKSVVEFGRLFRDPEHGEVFYVFLVDVQSKRQNFDIDKLTGLPGMRSFIESSDIMLKTAEISTGSRDHSLIFFDIANFKYYNINFGVSVGDKILQSVANLLTKYFHNNYIFRFSDDHFVVVTEAEGLEEKIRAFHDAAMELRKDDKILVKAGIFHIGDSKLSPVAACDLAKAACDEVINGEVDYYRFYTDELRKKLERKKYIIDNLDKAISENYIQVYYQSIIRSASGQICGKEALARWNDPNYGLLSPAEFIPQLEEAKLLYKLDLRIVELALADYQKRVDTGEPVINFSVNISRYDFVQCDMVREIADRIKAAGMPPELLTVEITETVQGMDPDFLKEQIRRFHEAGFKVWMDDFGSGFSSLNLLQDFDFDLIKLDTDLIKDFGRSRKNPIILKKLIELADELGVETLAEGVETEEQVRFLKEIGCKKIQGYYFSIPHPFSSRTEISKGGEALEYEDYKTIANRIRKTESGKSFAYNQSIDYDYFKLNTYRDIPVPFALYRVILNEKGNEVIDTEYVYVNQKYCELSGKSRDELVGRRFSEEYPDTGADWFPYCYRAAILGEEINDTIFSRETQLWLNFTIAPTSVQGYCAYTFLNIDRQYKEYELFERAGITDKTILNIVEQLNSRKPYQETMNAILEEIGNVIHPDRLYILETDGKTVNNTFEWCAEGVEPFIDALQNVPYEGYLDVWQEALGDQDSFVIENIESYRENNPQIYEILKMQNITSIIEAPLYDNGRIIGYLGADNYQENEELDTRRMLETVAHFIAKQITNYQLMKQLEFATEHDLLTGVENRYALKRVTANLEKTDSSVGIVFIDLNGLKETNDQLGHKAGDKLIGDSAEFLKRFFGAEAVFRTGGDEFNILLPGMKEETFRETEARFQQELKNSSLNMAVGFEWCPCARNLTASIAAADKKMYRNKAEYYTLHDRRKSNKKKNADT